MVACKALLATGSQNNPIVPVNIPFPAASTNPSQQSSSDLIVRFGDVTLEIRNNASATLIENTLRAIQNVR